MSGILTTFLLPSAWRIEYNPLQIRATNEGGGDEPYFATIGFRSRILTKGSTRVEWSTVIDGEWAEGSRAPSQHAIPPRQGAVRFPRVDLARDLKGKLPEVIGTVQLAFEQDLTESVLIKDMVDKVVVALRKALVRLVENANIAQSDEQRREDIKATVAAVIAEVTPNWFNALGLWALSGGDPDEFLGASVKVFGAVDPDFSISGFPRLTEQDFTVRYNRSGADYIVSGAVIREGIAGWETLDATVTAGPGICSWGKDRLDVFVRGGDANVWHKCFDGGWSDWGNLGGGIVGDISAVSWGEGRIDLVARGKDGSVLHKYFDRAWSGWESLGGQTGTDPAICSWGPGRLDIFARGTDGELWQRYFEGGWSEWIKLGGALSGSPTAVSSRHGRIDIVSPTVNGGSLQHRWFDSGWSGWTRIQGEYRSPGLASDNEKQLSLFGLDTVGGAHMSTFDGTKWSGWRRLGGGFHWGIAATSWKPGRLDVVAGTRSNDLMHATRTNVVSMFPPKVESDWKDYRNGIVTIDPAK